MKSRLSRISYGYHLHRRDTLYVHGGGDVLFSPLPFPILAVSGSKLAKTTLHWSSSFSIWALPYSWQWGRILMGLQSKF
jgi:hypothetical protein